VRATEPNVVWDLNKVGDDKVIAVVEALEGSEFVFYIVTSTRCKIDMIKVKPDLPEKSSEP
jgi:hypothetical protein